MPVITDEYRSLNAELHTRRAGYGANGHKWADRIAGYVRESGATTVLDYGTGKGTLVRALRKKGLECAGYDPAMEEWSADPAPADFIVCADVLEHVEPDCLDDVLSDLSRLMRKAGLLVISLIPSDKELADGRNAHLIIQPAEWWMNRLHERFSEVVVVPPRNRKTSGRELPVLVRP